MHSTGKTGTAMQRRRSIRSSSTRLHQAEELRQRLVGQRATMPAGLSLDRFDWRFLEREARQTLASWRTLATRHVTEARELLASLLHGPIVFTPFQEGSARGYRFRGHLELGRMLNGVVDVVRGICTPESTAFRLASPPGFEPGFQP